MRACFIKKIDKKYKKMQKNIKKCDKKVIFHLLDVYDVVNTKQNKLYRSR